MDLSYTWEKLYLAVNAMAASNRSIQDRLASAYLHFDVLRSGDFPEDLQERFKNIVATLTAVQAEGNGGKVKATVRRMSDETACQLANQIVELLGAVSRDKFR